MMYPRRNGREDSVTIVHIKKKKWAGQGGRVQAILGERNCSPIERYRCYGPDSWKTLPIKGSFRFNRISTINQTQSKIPELWRHWKFKDSAKVTPPVSGGKP